MDTHDLNAAHTEGTADAITVDFVREAMARGLWYAGQHFAADDLQRGVAWRVKRAVEAGYADALITSLVKDSN